MRKRILITTFTFPPERNGVSHVAEAQAYGLAKRGYEVVVATAHVPARRDMACPPNVEIREFDTSQRSRQASSQITDYERFIASFDGDAILCQAWQIWSTDLAIRAFASNRRPKRIMVSHGFSAADIKWTPRGVARWLRLRPYVKSLPAMLRGFDHVTFLSALTNRDWFYDHRIMDQLGMKHYSVVPNGVHLDRFCDHDERARRFRQAHQLGEAPVVLNVSNYDPRKNQQLAVDAFLAAGCSDATLVLIGSEFNDYSRSVQAAYERAGGGRAGRVLFLERISNDDIASAYCAADLFVCSATWELQPLVVLDAMASRLAFVSTDVGCVSELPGGEVVQGKTEMAATMRRLLGDSAARRQLAESGRAASLARYNWEANLDRYEHIIDSLCRGSQPQEQH